MDLFIKILIIVKVIVFALLCFMAIQKGLGADEIFLISLINMK